MIFVSKMSPILIDDLLFMINYALFWFKVEEFTKAINLIISYQNLMNFI